MSLSAKTIFSTFNSEPFLRKFYSLVRELKSRREFWPELEAPSHLCRRMSATFEATTRFSAINIIQSQPYKAYKCHAERGVVRVKFSSSKLILTEDEFSLSENKWREIVWRGFRVPLTWNRERITAEIWRIFLDSSLMHVCQTLTKSDLEVLEDIWELLSFSSIEKMMIEEHRQSIMNHEIKPIRNGRIWSSITCAIRYIFPI